MKVWKPAAPEDLIRHDPGEVFASGERAHHVSNTAYPLSHNVTWRPYRQTREHYARVVEEAFNGIEDLTLYSHIPFCETRCYFCEYTVVGKSELEHTAEYMNLLGRELDMYSRLLGRRRLHGMDIGGGTPSFVDASLIEAHLEDVASRFDFAPDFGVSIETTPKIAAAEPGKMEAYFKAGIRRISMGLQVVEPDLLRRLNRDTNDGESMLLAGEHIRRAGFQNFNLDVMYGFARQSLESLEHTLRFALNFRPESITLYRMRYKLTRISDEAGLVNLEHVRAHAKLASEILKEAGYIANPGKNTYTRKDIADENTGTSAYLTRRVIQGAPYLGIGLGAQTFTHTSIAYNDGAAQKSISPYRKSVSEGRLPIQDLYNLPAAHMMAKMIAVSFYFGEVNLAAFEEKFGCTLESAFPDAVSYALSRGLMHYTESKNGPELTIPRASLSLTQEGARHFNGTIALFFAPSVQSILLSGEFDFSKNQRAALAVGG